MTHNKFLKETPLLVVTSAGLYCPGGDFYIDPHRKVPKAIITHGHADHARAGHTTYLASDESEFVLKTRLGGKITLETIPFGVKRKIGSVEVSLHPAGHVLGSAQICIHEKGRKWVVTGDYKTEPDPATCTPFEPVECEALITETTFGLPIFQWKPQQMVFDEINKWWKDNSQKNILSIIYAYSLGKAQRLIAGVDHLIGPIYVHPTIAEMNEAYHHSGYKLPATINLNNNSSVQNNGLVITPMNTLHKLINTKEKSVAYASGWMMTARGRKGRPCDAGFVLSDHVDFPSILKTVSDCKAQTVFATHGYEMQMVHYLRSLGLEAYPLEVLNVVG